MQAGRVKVAEDSDFKHFIELCNETDGWKQEYNKRNTVVSTKTNDISEVPYINEQEYIYLFLPVLTFKNK
jgi:hypothetical protein